MSNQLTRATAFGLALLLLIISPAVAQSSRIDVSSQLAVPIIQVTLNSGSSLHPSFSGDGSLLAFTSSQRGNKQIFVARADGSIKQLTSMPGDNFDPMISPDGKMVVFVNNIDGLGEIYAVNSDGTNMRRLTLNSAVDQSPAISNEVTDSVTGQTVHRIVFSSNIFTDNNKNGRFQIWITNSVPNCANGSAGTCAKQLTSDDNNHFEPSISADGKTVAYVSDEGGSRNVFVISSDGSGQRRLTSIGSVRPLHPSITANGQLIAYQSNEFIQPSFTTPGNPERDFEIFTIPATGGNSKQLTFNGADDFDAAISLDGSRIAWVSRITGNDEIFVMNADGTSIREVTFNKATSVQPTITGNGGLVAYVSDVDGTPQVYIAIVSNTGATQLTFDNVDHRHAAVSDDGKKIVYTAEVNGKSQIFAVGADTSATRQLTSDSNDNVRPSISGDGRVVSYISRSSTGSSIFLINTDGSGVRQLTGGGDNITDQVLSADGSRLVYVLQTSQGPILQEINSDGSNPRRVTTANLGADLLNPSVSSDGSTIAFQSNAKITGTITGAVSFQITVVTASSSAPKQLTTDNLQHITPRVSKNGQIVTYVAPAGGFNQIWSIRSDGTGGPRQLTAFTNAFALQPSITTDGSRIAFISNVNGDPEVFLMNSDGTGLTQLTFDMRSAAQPVISGDGSVVVFSTMVSGYQQIVLVKATAFDFRLSAGSSSLSTQPGGISSTAIRADLISGDARPITLQAIGLPPNSFAVFSPSRIQPGSSATMTIFTDPGKTPAGTYTVTVTGDAGVQRSVDLTMTVSGSPQAFDFSVTTDKDRDSVRANDNASVTFSVTVNTLSGTPQPVRLSVLGLPENTTYVFAQETGTPPFSTTLTISTVGIVGSSITQRGDYVLLVTATTPVGISRTARITFTIGGGGGCLIATATYSSEVSPEVQLLRNFRDQIVLKTVVGFQFMQVFNAWYYSFSPTVAKTIAENDALRDFFKIGLYPLIGILRLSSGLGTALRLQSEAGVVLVGLLTSFGLGFVYAAPLGLACRFSRRFKPLSRAGGMRYLTHLLLISGLVLVLSLLLGIASLIGVTAVLLVLSALSTGANLSIRVFAAKAKARIS